VILIEGKIAGKNIKGDIWAADGPIYSPSCAYPGCTLAIPECPSGGTLVTPSSVKVIDLKNGKTKVVSTGGKARADELCYNPASNVVLVANPQFNIDNFITFIDEDNRKVLGNITFDGTDPNSAPPGGSNITANGIEQCVFDPRDGNFYLNIPATVGQTYSPQGVTLRISPTAPFQVLAAFPIPATTGCRGGSGLAVGPANQLLLSCGGTPPSTSSLIISDLFDGTAIVGVQPGADEVWYNSSTNHYYLPASTPKVLGVEDAGSVTSNMCNFDNAPTGCPTADMAIPTASGSHSVAADSVSNQVYVPIRGNSSSNPAGTATVCSSVTGNTADDAQGCIAVYNDPGEVPPGSP
jgi:hypothetical protein